MFRLVMAPVDLVHAGRLGRALQVTGDLAKHYGVPVCYVAVTSAVPGPVAHTPREFAAKLEAFAAEQSALHGIEARSHMVLCHDPATDMDDALLKTVREIGADLVVMASHIPNIADYVWPSNGGKIAGHSAASVFVVREH